MNRCSDAVLSMLVGVVIGIGLLATTRPALPPAVRGLSHAFAASHLGAVLYVANPEIARRIAPETQSCNSPYVSQSAAQFDAALPLRRLRPPNWGAVRPDV